MVWLMETLGWPANCESSAFQAEEQILERVEEEPDISTRRLAIEVGVSQCVVHRTLKVQGLYPYHVQKVQVWSPLILTHNVGFNSHNTHIWSDENPHACQEVRIPRGFSCVGRCRK